MTYLFVAAFIVGLLLAVRVMLYGVERGKQPFGTPPRNPAPVRMWEPVLAAFAIVAGVYGYLALRAAGDPTLHTSIAAGLGLVAAAGAVGVVKKAVAFVPEHDPDDPRYVLQGHVATVLTPIDGESDGEIEYTVEGRRHVVPARGLDGSTADAGVEVVIERIDEQGVAHVEPWAEVEKRI